MNIQEAIIKLLIEQPYYGYVASTVTLVPTEKIESIRMTSIPNLKIYYNNEWFDGLPNNRKQGVIIHELLHVILMHPHRRYGREIMLWSAACDMAVNELIAKKDLPDHAITVDIMSKKLRRNIEKNRNAEYYYDILSDVNNPVSFIMMENDTVSIFHEEENLKINKISEESHSSVEINALKNEIAQSLEEAGQDGEIPSILNEQVEEIYKDLKLNWRNILKRFLTGKGKIVVRKSYKRQSRRYENLPGTKRYIGVNALLAIDESGSISDGLVKIFYNELQSINKITGANIIVTRFDTQCTIPVPISKFIIDNKREKRGGTDFRPIFELADSLKIPLVIIFTDGDGTAPETVNQDTLWVLSKNTEKPANFGYCVILEG